MRVTPTTLWMIRLIGSIATLALFWSLILLVVSPFSRSFTPPLVLLLIALISALVVALTLVILPDRPYDPREDDPS